MIALIVAYAKNRVIGRDGKIPWHIKEDQLRFKELTMGNVVIMGRRTYEEIGHPLPGRDTIIVSSTVNYQAENCMTVRSLDEALAMANGRDVFVAGGESIYKEAMERKLVEVMYLTKIDAMIDGDTYFPEWDESEYLCTERITMKAVALDALSYVYLTYKRIAK